MKLCRCDNKQSSIVSCLFTSASVCLHVLPLIFHLTKERKRVLEAERQARVEELLVRRKEQEARIEQQRQEKEKAREDAARERARFVA